MPATSATCALLTLNNAAARKAALAGMKKILAVLRTRDGERARTDMREHLDVVAGTCVSFDDIRREAAADPRRCPRSGP